MEDRLGKSGEKGVRKDAGWNGEQGASGSEDVSLTSFLPHWRMFKPLKMLRSRFPCGHIVILIVCFFIRKIKYPVFFYPPFGPVSLFHPSESQGRRLWEQRTTRAVRLSWTSVSPQCRRGSLIPAPYIVIKDVLLFTCNRERMLKAQLVAVLLWLWRLWSKREISCCSRGGGQLSFSDLCGMSTTSFPWNCQ